MTTANENRSNLNIKPEALQVEMSATSQIYQGFLIFVELMWVFVKMAAYMIEDLYLKIFPPEEASVKGEIVLITGAGHGIGKELALQYAALGATVVSWDINVKENEATIKEINDRGYPNAYAYYCDVSNKQNVFEVAKKVQQEVGDVTILINNAGIMYTKPFLEHTQEQIERTMNINVLAHFWTVQAFLPAMRKNDHGHVVALCSLAGTVGVDNCAAYCASKFAVRGLMEVLFNECRVGGNKSNIYVTSVYPFIVDTGMCKKPRNRFPNLMHLLKPKEVASQVINAQRRKAFELSLPGHMLNLNSFFRLLPLKVTLAFTDFLGSGIDSA